MFLQDNSRTPAVLIGVVSLFLLTAGFAGNMYAEEEKVLPALLELLEDTDETKVIRLEVLHSLSDFIDAGDQKVAESLLNVVKDAEDSACIRREAINALIKAGPEVQGKLGADSEAVESLLYMAHPGAVPGTRLAAVEALEAIGVDIPESAKIRAPAGERGLIGPGQSTEHMVKPPFNPDSWHKMDGYVLDSDSGWGRRFKPRAVFQLPGGIGLLYNSRPPAGFDAPEGFASQQTGSLAYSRNLTNWHDYPGNPVLYELQDWQGSLRAMPRAMLYDEGKNKWVVYFGDADGDYPGIRAAGTAYSRDLVNWHYEEDPTLTVMDFAEAVPELIEATEEELQQEGRIYPSWAIFHDGRYYLCVSGTIITGSNRRYHSIILISDNPAGPFEPAEVKGDFNPQGRPLFSGGMWYTVFSSEWDGQPGFGLARSESLLGPYEKNPHNPIITVDTTSRARPQLFRYNGTWAILFARFYDYFDMRLRVATANISPDIIPFGDEDLFHKKR